MYRFLLIPVLFLLHACVGVPPTVTPVTNFELERYLGRWYEIARLDHRFERGLSHVTAEYSLRDDGAVRVLNRGWSAADNAWEEAEGVARFVEDRDTGYLKVSFFGPFYGAYVIAELGEDYGHALVSGPDYDYLWILSRSPTLPEGTVQALVDEAARLGFPVDELIMVEQSNRPVAP